MTLILQCLRGQRMRFSACTARSPTGCINMAQSMIGCACLSLGQTHTSFIGSASSPPQISARIRSCCRRYACLASYPTQTSEQPPISGADATSVSRQAKGSFAHCHKCYKFSCMSVKPSLTWSTHKKRSEITICILHYTCLIAHAA